MLKKIKRWIVDFDIKPKPPVVAAMLDAAQESIYSHNIAQAIQQLKEVLLVSRLNKTALELLSRLYLDYSYAKPALKLLRFALRHYPQEMLFWRYYGILLCLEGQKLAGIKSLEHAIRLEPDNNNTKHLLQAAHNDTSQNTNIDYVKNLFNYYASDFEESLINNLMYSGPLHVINYVSENIGSNFASILDLGCGTGLVGKQIAQSLQYHSMIGIDIASEMLAKAREKNIYSELIQNEIVDYLQHAKQTNAHYNLIVCVDVFMYIGELSALFKAVAQILQPADYFVFTVEDNPHHSDYALKISGRFLHNKNYILRILDAHGLQVLDCKPQIMRYERTKPVNCYMYIAHRAIKP